MNLPPSKCINFFEDVVGVEKDEQTKEKKECTKDSRGVCGFASNTIIPSRMSSIFEDEGL